MFLFVAVSIQPLISFLKMSSLGIDQTQSHLKSSRARAVEASPFA